MKRRVLCDGCPFLFYTDFGAVCGQGAYVQEKTAFGTKYSENCELESVTVNKTHSSETFDPELDNEENI